MTAEPSPEIRNTLRQMGQNVMLTPGGPAPRFDCTAVVAGELVELTWDQLHENKTLVLLFDAVANDRLSDDLIGLTDAAARIASLPGKVALVCRDHAFEIMAWLDRSPAGEGSAETAFPVIVDSDDAIASLYDMVSAEGCALWGRVIVDPAGSVRQLTMTGTPVGTDADELIRCIQSINSDDC